jgi:hypothetical protein
MKTGEQGEQDGHACALSERVFKTGKLGSTGAKALRLQGAKTGECARHSFWCRHLDFPMIYIAFKGSFCSRFSVSIPSHPLDHYFLDVPPTSNTHPGCPTTFSSRHDPVTRHSNNTPLTAHRSRVDRNVAGNGKPSP